MAAIPSTGTIRLKEIVLLSMVEYEIGRRVISEAS